MSHKEVKLNELVLMNSGDIKSVSITNKTELRTRDLCSVFLPSVLSTMSEMQKPESEVVKNEPEEGFEQLPNMNLTTRLILGECRMEIAEILKLGQGSVLELDALADEPLELWVNDQKIARVHPVLSQNKVGAQILKLTSKAERIKEIALTPVE